VTFQASVIVATRNRAQQLRVCLAALGAQSAAGRFEVVVADNGSSDATRQVIAEAGMRGLHVAEPNRAKARNAAIAAARGDLLIFCDDDTVAPHAWVEAHLASHERAANTVVTGPIINVADVTESTTPGARHWSRAFFCTCNASVAKDAVHKAGGFDEQYELYGWEDTDLGLRLRANGLRRVFSWAAFIYHVKPPEVMTLDRRRSIAREKGMMAARFVRKNPTWPVKLATGAYSLNFARAAVLGSPPLRALCARALRGGPQSALGKLAAELVVDAAYVRSLRAALREQRATG
jgi:glycosyltransferase involved in cell wall biosynthesis